MTIMNNNKIYKWLSGVMMTAVLAAGITACTDDHFDVNSEVTGRGTLWENIKANSSLSEYADILQSTSYSQTEGSSTVQTYADIFNGDATYTVWAPTNGTFDYSTWKSLLADGTYASKYKVEKELIRNNMTRFTHVMTGNDQYDLDLFNDKTAIFDCANATFAGKSITTSNIGATNGVLHVINGNAEYQPNLYEYMATRSDLDSLNTFIKSYENIEFDENNSTQGPTIDGEITWVDSVTYTSNDYFQTIGYLNREDSLYAMIMPTNSAWEKALAKTKKYYNYMSTYEQNVVTVSSDGTETTSKYTTSFSDLELDSLINMYSKSAICSNLSFNANYQYYPFDKYNPGNVDSLRTVSYNILRQKEMDLPSLFDGVQPIELSNGYAYVVDNFNFPSSTWATEKEIEAERTSNIEKTQRCTLTQTKISLTAKNYPNYPDMSVSEDTIISLTVARTVQTSSSANPVVTFIIPRTLSCKYDIYALMAYNSDANLPNQFRASITYHDGTKPGTTSQNLTVPADDAIHGSGNNFQTIAQHIDETTGKCVYVDSVCLARDFEFPVCYAGLENAYVTITLTSYVSSSQTKNFSREMWIDKLYLKAKDDAE